MKEIEPLCVLDFYVHETCQRRGYGQELFEAMLSGEKQLPHKLAYDKPTMLFLNFLKKNYGLTYFVPQVNNYVVFSNYFHNDRSYRCMQKDPVPQVGLSAQKKQPMMEPKREEPQREQMPSYSDMMKQVKGHAKP